MPTGITSLTTISTGRCHKPTTISASRRLYSTAVRATESTPRWVVLTHHLRLTLSRVCCRSATRMLGRRSGDGGGRNNAAGWNAGVEHSS